MSNSNSSLPPLPPLASQNNAQSQLTSELNATLTNQIQPNISGQQEATLENTTPITQNLSPVEQLQPSTVQNISPIQGQQLTQDAITPVQSSSLETTVSQTKTSITNTSNGKDSSKYYVLVGFLSIILVTLLVFIGYLIFQLVNLPA